MPPLLFLKLGGSLITDKSQPRTTRHATIRRLATEIAAALEARPDLQLLVGHGSGSFGHVEAQKYGTRKGVHSLEAWRGFAEVSAVAAKLNRIVFDALQEAGVPVFNVQPSASALAREAQVVEMALLPIRTALQHGLVPLVYGDVAIDEQRAGTIISTEDIFRYLATQLNPVAILLAGIERGVLSTYPDGELIPEITPETWNEVRSALRGVHTPDVTGGMAGKVREMLAQATAQPGLTIRVFSGEETGLVREMLLGTTHAGTLIHA